MGREFDDQFIQALNKHINIAHKVCNLYYYGSEHREDVFQEMMYQLCTAYPHFQHKAKFSTWMYRVCLNTAINFRKKESKHTRVSISEDHHEIPDEPESVKSDNMQQLYRAIESLSKVNKAIVLCYLEDLSYEEIADITGLTKSNVSVRLVRIKKELEKKLQASKATSYAKY